MASFFTAISGTPFSAKTTRLIAAFSIVFSSFGLSLPIVSFAADQGVKAPAFVTLNAIPVCYDFGCKSKSTVNLPVTEWKGVTGWFLPVAETPEQERDQIKQAIGWMEVLIGRHTPTHKDLAFDLPPEDDVSHLFPGNRTASTKP